MKTSRLLSRRAARIVAALLLAGVCGLTGCLSRPALTRQTFTFDAPTISATNAVAGGRVLGIRSLQIAAPFDGRSFVYRTGEFSYVRDPYAGFLEPPAEELIAPMRGWLREQRQLQCRGGSRQRTQTGHVGGDQREPAVWRLSPAGTSGGSVDDTVCFLRRAEGRSRKSDSSTRIFAQHAIGRANGRRIDGWLEPGAG